MMHLRLVYLYENSYIAKDSYDDLEQIKKENLSLAKVIRNSILKAQITKVSDEEIKNKTIERLYMLRDCDLKCCKQLYKVLDEYPH